MKQTEEYYTNNEILMRFNRLNDKQTVSILHDALNYMEEYNVRSRVDPINGKKIN